MDRVRITGVGVLVTALCGCISSAGRPAAQYARVDDVTGEAPFVSGYCVVAVDGKPVQRARSAVDTVIPIALIDPGEHTLSVKIRGAEPPAEMTVSARFEEGKRYRLKRENGEVSVVEDSR